METAGRFSFGWMVLLTWFCLAALLILKAVASPGGLVLSTDDAMRLVQVRDLLHGQSWFDPTQHRMNAPYGLPMHWSRLVDACIAGLILFLRLFTDPKTAEAWAVLVWPLLPLLPVMFALSHMGAQFVGRVGALFGLALGASCVAAMTPFKPGNIDHHNVQLALGLSCVAFLIDLDRSRWAAGLAAIMAALSLAVGLETLPYIVVVIIALAVWWIVDPRLSSNLRIFGVAFATANGILLLTATASPYRFSTTCDTFSGFYAALGVLTGVGGAALAYATGLNTPSRRAIGAGALALLVFLSAALMGPSCLHGPYVAVDPRLGPIWLAGVAENQSPFRMGLIAPGDFVGGYAYCVLAAIASVTAVFLVDACRRPAMMLLCAVALMAFAVATTQMRGIAFALLFGTPGVVVVATNALTRIRVSKAMSAVATFAAVLVASDASYAVVGEQIQKALPKKKQYAAVQQSWMAACMAPKDYTELAGLPRGRVAAFVDLGPAILAYTHHSALAGPYHRNSAGILDSYAILAGSATEQRAVLKLRGVDYVVLCEPAPDTQEWGARARPDSLLKVYAAGGSELWLQPLVSHPKHGQLKILRVQRALLN